MNFTTPKFDAATNAQVKAARPDASTWLSANAGSGKTRVLTDRVARLLLEDVPPERILCLTYTKAAAAEMQNRLFRRLGEWAMMPDQILGETLAGLGVEPASLSPELLSKARTLFARAIEAPGGLKIQTIHSFCSSVLRRFPVEAGVSPGFTEMDDRAQRDLGLEVIDRLSERDSSAQGAIDAIAHFLSDESAWELSRAILSKRDAFTTPLKSADLRAFLDLGNLTPDAIIAQSFEGGERDLCTKLVPLLPAIVKYDKARRVLGSINWDAPDFSDLSALEDLFLFGATAKAANMAKVNAYASKEVRAAMGDDLEALHEFMLRLQDARPLRRAWELAAKTEALHAFAQVFLPAYDRAKDMRGWLDFDDLIRRTRDLLTTREVAQWVLFRLDGGIDHILVDEAQDTSPAQWNIIETLAEEFAAGEGARADVLRTIFVVGDKKQSIYSFQGADPEGFDQMRDHFEARHLSIGRAFQTETLAYSFRSAEPILALVDEVARGTGGEGLGADVTHFAHKTDLAGRIDIWPHIPKSEDLEKQAWFEPVDKLADAHHSVILAKRVANFIRETLEQGVHIPHKGSSRPARPSDFLVLVRSRSDLFHEIIAEIKKHDLPIAGADRMRVAAELAVRDLMALMAFLATPEDDLSLASVLRSPLCGLTEQQLFELSHDRAKATLWRRLRDRAGEFTTQVEMLSDLRNKADFMRPYDLLERVLVRHKGRQTLLARLGAEAEDGIDAMLAQALSYERNAVPSLTGFVGWLQTGNVEIKRDLSNAGEQIRVMTIHGAKGLEAPIVILPDTAQKRGNPPGVNLLLPEDGMPVWPAAKAEAPPQLEPAYEEKSRKAIEEENRLLYVALTRAETWLVVAAAGNLAKEENGTTSWFQTIEAAAQSIHAKPHPFEEGDGLRLEKGAWPSDPSNAFSLSPPERSSMPQWAVDPAPPSRRDEATLSPSDLGGEKYLTGPSDSAPLSEDEAMARGRRMHLLLEHLPRLSPAAWPHAAAGILALDGEVSDAEADILLEEATRVLTKPDLAHLFTGDALAEVSLAAQSPTLGRKLLGVIDRLVVTPTRVTAIDFKSNAVLPDTPEATPEAILRQMGAYAEILRAIYPDREIELGILWTRRAEYMVLPHAIVMAALQRAAGS